MHTCVYAYANVCMRVCIHVCMRGLESDFSGCLYVHAYKCMFIRMYVQEGLKQKESACLFVYT